MEESQGLILVLFATKELLYSNPVEGSINILYNDDSLQKKDLILMLC